MATLQVSDLKPSELSHFPRITTLAFQSGLGHLLTGPATPQNIDTLTKKCVEAVKSDPHVRFMKATTLSGQIVACAKWFVYTNGNTEEELDEMFKMPTTFPKTWDPIFMYLNASRRETMGRRPYYFLSILATHPEHHRKGAGRKLVKWGTDLADKQGIECYLESSIEGRPLYERLGFRVVKEVPFNLEDFGRPDLGTDVNCIMLREPSLERK
ncbi:acyl-CoA N-acyltransferase [Venturia nashicola]|uniref:Acyl-CoA N-acyltransferase n=1 Tax=Venturia nashicola TaxID=86259 RepID=A0A4Z1P651_9PEZI|nr:acyl-CoA N-acyltransferase [Venturia nashicola]TLD26198.1 acyl-CoA N-acyltransferase [Venturia nashicola]